MKQLTQSEIARTAFKEVLHERWKSPYGYTHPQRNKNEMCPYCKNEDTEVIRSQADLKPFAEFYKDKVKDFTAVRCGCCEGMWSYYKPL